MDDILNKKCKKKYNKKSKKDKIKYLEKIKNQINLEIEKIKIDEDEIIVSLKNHYHEEYEEFCNISYQDSDFVIDDVIDSMQLFKIQYDSDEQNCEINIYIKYNINKNDYICHVANNKNNDSYTGSTSWFLNSKKIIISKGKKKDAIIIKEIDKITDRLLKCHHFVSYVFNF